MNMERESGDETTTIAVNATAFSNIKKERYAERTSHDEWRACMHASGSALIVGCSRAHKQTQDGHHALVSLRCMAAGPHCQ